MGAPEENGPGAQNGRWQNDGWRPRKPGLFRFVAGHADGVGDVVEFLVADVFELLAFGGELFVDLNDLFGHDLVGLLGAAHEQEILAGGQPFVPVGIESEAQHHGLARPFLLAHIRHAVTLGAGGRRVKERPKSKVQS